jgi:hypothetical protein
MVLINKLESRDVHAGTVICNIRNRIRKMRIALLDIRISNHIMFLLTAYFSVLDLFLFYFIF